MPHTIGTILEGHQSDSGHKVTTAESVQGYVYFLKKVGTDQQIQLEQLMGYNETTVSKIVTLGYRCLAGHDHHLKQATQAADVNGIVALDHRPIVRAKELYIRVEDPALADIIHLVFTARVVEE